MSPEVGHGEEHGRRHPLGRVPVLETDDGLLFESAGLCLHVADLYPEAGLIPAPGSFERGQVYQWAFLAMDELEPAVIRTFLARRGSDAEATAKAEARLAKVGDVVADALDGRSYLVGDRFTVADIVVGGVLESARRFELFPEGASTLLDYLEQLDERPAKQVAFED